MNAGLPVAEPRYLSLSDVVPSCCSKRLTDSARLRAMPNQDCATNPPQEKPRHALSKVIFAKAIRSHRVPLKSFVDP